MEGGTMIVVYGGGRPSGSGRAFWESRIEQVLAQLELMIAGLRPRLLVGSAAAGADLLVLSVATKLAAEFNVARHVVTAGDEAAFRAAVVDRVGHEWTRRYDGATPFHKLTELDVAPDDAGFAAVNDEIVRLARAARHDGEPVVCIRVGPPRDRPGRDLGVDLRADLARDLDFDHLVLTVRTGEKPLPDAFVAMPFDTNEVPERGWAKYKSDVSYERIFVPALIAAGFTPRRVDNDNLSELIDSAMLRQLGGAKFVVGDLTTGNPNVFWELGIRHAWRPGGTSLVCLEGENLPFDINRIPVCRYYRDEGDVSDADLVRSLKALVRVFTEQAAHLGSSRDSPVFEHLPGLRPVTLPDSRDPEGHSEADKFDRKIGRACQLRQVSALQALAGELERSRLLSDPVRERLHGNIAYGLISLGQLDAAQELLRPLAESDSGLANVILQQYYAHTLVRGTEGDRDQELREAEWRLEALLERGPDPETCGLLGSAAKVMAERAMSHGDHDRMVACARAAAEAYEKGFRADVRAYYPGVNVVALRRLLGQRWDPNEKDRRHARDVLPVVRYVVRSALDRGGAIPWVDVTDAELDLHEFLLDAPDTAARPSPELAQTFDQLSWKVRYQDQVRASFGRQLRLMQLAGDPPELIADLLRRLDA
jgi:hypothetical protein